MNPYVVGELCRLRRKEIEWKFTYSHLHLNVNPKRGRIISRIVRITALEQTARGRAWHQL